MKKFTCLYIDGSGSSVRESKRAITAENVQSAADLYSKEFPAPYPNIEVINFLSGRAEVKNPRFTTLRAQEKEARAQEEASRIAARVESLKELWGKVENTNGNLGDLSYDDLCALIKNMQDFPSVRDELGPEECPLREKLFMIASFDKSLQALLQTQEAKLQTSLLTQIASGQTTRGATSSAGSNLAKNAALLGGAAALHKLNQIEENTGDVSEGLGFD